MRDSRVGRAKALVDDARTLLVEVLDSRPVGVDAFTATRQAADRKWLDDSLAQLNDVVVRLERVVETDE